jgi:hypothetical protein
VSSILTPLLTSAGLGVGAGLNAYATLLVFGLLSRFRPGMFHGELADFFASTPVLIVVGILYAVEFVADKVPAVDHVWDVIHTFIRPAAGALVALAAMAPGLPCGGVILAGIIAGATALTAHVAKATTRAASSVVTGGLGNPILSLIEDVLAFGGALIAIFLPLLVLVLIGLLVWMLVRIFRARRPPLPSTP